MGIALRRREMDMTTGSIFHKMVLFALPIVLTNLLQTLYNVADMVVVGRFSTVDGAVGAIGCTSSFVTLMNNFIFGLSTGATVVVAQAIGASDREAIKRGVHTSLLMGVIVGFVCLALGQALCMPMLTWMDTAEEYKAMAAEYCRICFAGLPFVALLNCALGVMRAKGDSTRPLVILSLSGVLNVVLNVIFVMVFRMDVDGVALATLVSNIASAVAALVYLARDDGACRFRVQDLHIHPSTMRKVLSIGVPSGMQGTLFTISNMINQAAINSFGLATITASSIEVNLHNFIYTACNAIGSASMTFAGQNVGARKYRRIMPTLFNGYLIILLLGGVLAALTFVFLDPLAALYMNEATTNRAEIFEIVRLIAIFRVLFMPVCGLMDCGALTLRGIGRSTMSMVVSLVGACGLRIVWIYTVFAVVHEQWALFISYPISWAVTALAAFLCVWLTARKLVRQSQPTPETV